jgi:acetoin utilization protein AcuB
MKVRDLMTKKIITIAPEDKIDRVFFLLNFEKIRHLPVVDRGKVVGMVSDRDMKKTMGSLKKHLPVSKGGEITVVIKSRQVRTIMKRGVLTTSPNAEASEAASIMAKRKIGALPVVQNNQLVGIITTTDILRGYVKLSAMIAGRGLVADFEKNELRGG